MRVKYGVGAGLAALFVVAACGGTSAPPLVTPNQQPTPSPIASTTAMPLPTASSAAVAPAASPSPEATTTLPPLGPSPTPVGALLGTDILLYVDEFDDPGSGWGEGQAETVSAAYQDSALRLEVTGGDGSVGRNTRQLDAPFDAVRFAALYEIAAGSGFYGAYCMDTAGNYYGGAVSTDGSYGLYRRVGSTFELLDRFTDAPLPDTGVGNAVMVMVECAVTSAGGLEVYLSANGTLLLHQTETISSLENIEYTGLFLESESAHPFVANVSEAAAWVATASGEPRPTPANDLLTYVPLELVPSCTPIEVTDAGALYAVACRENGAFVSYTQYSDPASLIARFDEIVEQNAPSAQENNDCRDGQPGYGDWTIASMPAGRYVCFVTHGYSFITWTTDALTVLSTTNRPDENIQELWEFWTTVGPNP